MEIYLGSLGWHYMFGDYTSGPYPDYAMAADALAAHIQACV